MAAFRRINALTPARGNENAAFEPNIGLKNGFASERKHNRPKQAFGELKNVLLNCEPKFSNNIKKNIFQNFQTPKNCDEKKSIKYDLKSQYDNLNIDFGHVTIQESYKTTEDHWAKKIALTDEECDRMLAPQCARKDSITIAEVCEIINRDSQNIDENSLDKLLEEELENCSYEMNRQTEKYEFNLPDINDIPEPKLDNWLL